MSARTLLAEWLWPRDGRSAAEIEAAVREELDSHIEQLVDEHVRDGATEDDARRRAAAQFGDVDRYVAQCRRIDLGDRLIVRRALAAACLILLAACGYLGWRVGKSERTAQRLQAELAAAVPTGAAGPSRDAWIARLVALRDHMHTAFAVGPELTLLEPDEGLAIVREAWPKITAPEVKTGLLKTFAFSKALPAVHPRLFDVLDLGMNDPDNGIRSYAAAYLEEYAGENFADRPDDYQAWRLRIGSAAPEDVRRLLTAVQRVPAP